MWTVAILLASVAGGEPPRWYTNPVYPGDFPDPFVIRHGGRFYAYATQSGADRFQVMESDDVVEWRERVLDFEVPWSKQHLWAPEVHERQGTLYLTYSALDPQTRKHHIGIATAEAPLGPFTHRAILVRGDDNEVGVIDATIAHEGGVDYLVYSEERPRRIVARRLRSDWLAVEGEPVELIRPDLPDEDGVVEAPTVIRRAGRVHLLYSSGVFQGTKQSCRYAVRHAVSESLLGPYRKSPRPLLAGREGGVYGPGHQCVVELADGTSWMLYHGWSAEGEPRYGRNPRGRTLRLDRLEWDGQMPRVLGPTLTRQPAPRVGNP
ncbi:MAG: glycosyl hydrolase [Isosphaeraceae bacterium]|nr:MAG: glycosyl hydrolase [Isosphaeraceae bacterium]